MTKRVLSRLKLSGSAMLVGGAVALLVQSRAVANDEPAKTARYYRQQAAAAYNAKDYAAAIENFKKAAEIIPDHPTLFYNLGCRLEVLEANNPVFLDPTLGVLVNGTFYFIANSQWPLVDENGKLAAEDKLRDPLVLKLNLDAL